MTKPLSDKVLNLKPSGIRKFFDIVHEMKDAISLGVGEPDFDTPWHIRDEGIYALEKGKTFYTSNAGLKELREEISKKVFDTRNVSYDPNGEILVTVGGSEAIDVGLRAIINEGDEVIIPEPSYVSYTPCAILADAKPVIIPLKAENDFRLTFDELKAAITNKTKAIILPYPNNPTGAIMEKKDLEAIRDLIVENDLYVLSDEIYSALTYKEKHFSIVSLPNMKERTILIDGFSKAYAMTGWRLGYACAPKEIIQQMTKIHQFAIMCAPTTSQYSAIEALRNCDEAVDKMRKEYDMRRRFMRKGFLDMGLDCYEAEGAFYLFPSIKSTGLSSEEFCERLLFEQKVAVVPGTAFGECGEGYIRCSYAYSIEEIRTALSKIEVFVKSLKK